MIRGKDKVTTKADQLYLSTHSETDTVQYWMGMPFLLVSCGARITQKDNITQDL
ncbi:hypothetical protein [Paenibacillus glacialis]|uniref:hypothetical protein n=1 Tax=Paenibacillus glacialis TaxID=494026 RepID=UPI000ADC3E2E|nr:hypothetical protein [Paenibacillus glacialis]